MIIYNYIFVGLLLFTAIAFALAPLVLVAIVAPRKRSLAKDDIYECGVRTHRRDLDPVSDPVLHLRDYVRGL